MERMTGSRGVYSGEGEEVVSVKTGGATSSTAGKITT